MPALGQVSQDYTEHKQTVGLYAQNVCSSHLMKLNGNNSKSTGAKRLDHFYT